MSSTSSVPHEKSARRCVLAATILGSSMVFIDGTVVNVALPALQSSFRATAVDVQVAVSDRVLHLRIRDNGRGGANFTHGTGLDITLPLGEPGWPGPPPEAARHTRVGRQEVPKSEAQGPLSAAKSNASSKR